MAKANSNRNGSIVAVAYYRMSSDKQEASIPAQRRAVESYALNNGYHIVREYQDAVSGWKSTQRSGFLQLIEDASSKRFQAVLCWDQDRFSRFDLLEANHYWYLLDREGVWIETVNQGRLSFDDLGEWLKASVNQHAKASYVRDLARNTARGLREAKRNGRWVGAAPLGYRLVNGKLELGRAEDVALIRRIFGRRLDGAGLLTIARELNRDGIPTPRGAHWSDQGIRHILQRDAYVGDVVIGKHARGKFCKLVDGVERVEGVHPAIITRKDFAAVQAKQAPWRAGSGRVGRPPATSLGGLVFCGRCGSPMYNVASGRINYYKCAAAHIRGKCQAAMVNRKKLETAVANAIQDKVLCGSYDALVEAIEKKLKKKPRKSPVAGMRAELAKLDARIARGVSRILDVDASLVKQLESELLAWKARRSALAAEIELSSEEAIETEPKKIASKLWQLDEVFRTGNSVEVRRALGHIIERIELTMHMIQQGRRRRTVFDHGEIHLQKSVQPSRPIS